MTLTHKIYHFENGRGLSVICRDNKFSIAKLLVKKDESLELDSDKYSQDDCSWEYVKETIKLVRRMPRPYGNYWIGIKPEVTKGYWHGTKTKKERR